MRRTATTGEATAVATAVATAKIAVAAKTKTTTTVPITLLTSKVSIRSISEILVSGKEATFLTDNF